MQDSDMDVSRTDDAPLFFARKDVGVAKLGYQGWAARRLVLACHRIFVNGDQSSRNDLVSVSLEHRGVIFWCLSNINADVVSPASSAVSEAELRDEDVFHDGLTDFYHVWTLAEAFLLDSAPLPAAPLLRWLKMYNQSGEDEALRAELDEAERVALEAGANGAPADLTPAYWNALRSLVVKVNPRRAAEMLRSHPEGRDNASEVSALARQLEKMPLLLPERAEDGDSGGGGGGAETHLDREGFFETWTRWQKGCKAAAAGFGVVAGAGGGLGGEGGFGPGGGEERRRLRWLWGTLCGERGCLAGATDSWSGLFAAVLAFERPDMRKEEVASVMRECDRTHPSHPEEEFLLHVIRDASAGAVESILRFACEHGDTLALSACATHLVDLLFRAELPTVTNAQRSWFFRRLADRLKAYPGGGWELAAAYVRASGESGEGDNADALRDLTRTVVPESERATHELVEWCRVNGLGEETAAAVCRARGAAWLGKTGLSAAAMGMASRAEEKKRDGRGGDSARVTRVPGACGKAAYWLAKGGGGVQLERLCAEVSERLMVEVSALSTGASDVKAQQAAMSEAEGILAAIPPGMSGLELSFLEQYKAIADLLFAESDVKSRDMEDSPGCHARLAGSLAVDMLAPRERTGDAAATAVASAPGSAQAPVPSLYPEPPPRSWAHLLRLVVPALRSRAKADAFGGGRLGEDGSPASLSEAGITAPQIHALLAKMQALVASESRVGSDSGDGGRASALSSAPAPYGFRGGKEEILDVRRALAGCLSASMMAQNAEETAPEAARRAGRKTSVEGRRLPADALILPRVAV